MITPIRITKFLAALFPIKIRSGCDLDLIPQGIFGTKKKTFFRSFLRLAMPERNVYHDTKVFF